MSAISSMHVLLAITVSTLTSEVAHAGDNELSLGSSTRALRTSSANAVTDESLVGGSLGYGRTLHLAPIPGVTLAAMGTFAWSDADGRVFQRMTTTLDTLSLSLGGRARYAIHRRLVASATLTLGMTKTSLELYEGDHTAFASGWAPLSHVGVALDLVAVRMPRVNIALRAELGYVGAAPVNLVARPAPKSDDTLQLDMSAASLGTLNLSGPVFAMSVVAEL